MEKLILATIKLMLAVVIVSSLGCTDNDKYEYESYSNFNKAQRLLDSPSIENLKAAESHLKKVDMRSVLYKDAQNLLQRIPSDLKNLENNNYETELKKITKEQLAEIYSDRWLNKFGTATEITFTGNKKRTMKVMVSYQANQANKVIHDYSLIDNAKKAGIKRIEFHDWSGFSKEYLSHDIK
ncbi:hypothetical protein BAC3_01262 [uncultured bacterium]|nr:hypothetical protein BAC3_01262 [uncultured bacterium]